MVLDDGLELREVFFASQTSHLGVVERPLEGVVGRGKEGVAGISVVESSRQAGLQDGGQEEREVGRGSNHSGHRNRTSGMDELEAVSTTEAQFRTCSRV
jgi:hypothetical protein